ncbi:MAG TPA: hypothetical protein VHU19_11660 [Pyrinomonadaceae bacterium]|jgi:hypothetical protein|nr:hypothetical protein [Pyrinomonadaceae bacterium]
MKIYSFVLVAGLACTSPLMTYAGDDVSRAATHAERVSPAGEVVVVLSEEFLNSLLQAVASQPEPPSFPLSKDGGAGGKCASQVQLLSESAGTRTAVRFSDGRITAPVAFRGSYAAPLVGCLNFEGWADTAFNLEFDEAKQVLNARVTVRELKLKNVPAALVGTGLTGLVQDAIDARVNPVEILRAEQLGARLPITRGNELRLRARDVRHEVVGSELRLHIVYEIVRE